MSSSQQRQKLKYDTFILDLELGPFVITPPNVITLEDLAAAALLSKLLL